MKIHWATLSFFSPTCSVLKTTLVLLVLLSLPTITPHHGQSDASECLFSKQCAVCFPHSFSTFVFPTAVCREDCLRKYVQLELPGCTIPCNWDTTPYCSERKYNPLSSKKTTVLPFLIHILVQTIRQLACDPHDWQMNDTSTWLIWLDGRVFKKKNGI